jgi:hypothetical protein
VPRRRWINHTNPMWLWGYSLFMILSPGPFSYGTKWLLWRLHKQSPTFHPKCRIGKGLTKKGKNNRSLKVAGQGLQWPTPCAFIHSVVFSFLFMLLLYHEGSRYCVMDIYHTLYIISQPVDDCCQNLTLWWASMYSSSLILWEFIIFEKMFIVTYACNISENGWNT